MMYHSDAKVLAACKKMQQIEGDFILINGTSIRHCTGFESEAVNRSVKSEHPKLVKMEQTSFDACLLSLTKSGMLKTFGNSPAIQVTHDGWNAKEVIRRERREFIMTHALFPSFVSLGTTVLLWVIKARLF